MRTNLIATARTASRSVLVGGLAAVSFAVTGVALAAAGGPATPTTPTTPNSHAASQGASHAATGKPSAKPSHSSKPDTPDTPDANRSCPWPTPAVTATPHDNGLHCGWYKPGHRDGQHPGKGNGGVDNSSAHPHPSGKGNNPNPNSHANNPSDSGDSNGTD